MWVLLALYQALRTAVTNAVQSVSQNLTATARNVTAAHRSPVKSTATISHPRHAAPNT